MAEIIIFLLRVAFLVLLGFLAWVFITQIILPIIYKQPVFPSIAGKRGSTLTDIREWQHKRLLEELEDKKSEIELARLEAELQKTRDEVDKEKARSAGDDK